MGLAPLFHYLSAMIYYIYALYCPVDSIVKYIGLTTDINTRYYNHVRVKNKTDNKSLWVASLIELQCYPIMVIINQYEDKLSAMNAERKLICALSETILNHDNDKRRARMNSFQYK